jgi:hypothetical protein
MKSALIGHTGFVGSNIANQHKFTHFYNSKNISEIKNGEFDLVVCAGVPAAMWLANKNEAEVLANIRVLTNLLKTVSTKRLVLISTISVYKQGSENQLENEAPSFEQSLPYGKNRRITELELSEHFPERHIIRLPALFGEGLKKNFIFDLIKIAPKFLSEEKYKELSNHPKSELLESSYSFNGKLWECSQDLSSDQFKELQDFFKDVGFSALNFTNAESMYQFYNLDHIWKDITFAIENSLKELNICSPPISAKELAKHLTGNDFSICEAQKQNFNMMTKYGNNSPYLYSKDEVLKELKAFYQKNKVAL